MAKMPKSLKSKQPTHLAERVRQMRKRLKPAGASALLLTNPCDIRYLTGFVGDDSWALIPMRGSKVYILSDFRFEEQIQNESPHAVAIMRKKTLVEEVAVLTKRLGADKIAVQPGTMTLSIRKTLAKHLGARRILAMDDGMFAQRAIKDDGEVKAIRKAISIQQQAFRETCDFIKPGQSEYEVAAYLEYRMRALGADAVSFPSIVAADANASLPHAVPGKTKIKAGGIVLIDWGAKWEGYCSDLTRVVGVGKMKPKIREIYQIVLDAQVAAIDAIRPGKRQSEIDAVARRVIEKAGYGDRFGHSLGHGIGLDIHELPVLATKANGVLEPGQVVTVEPGIYLPGIGGVRIEDDVLVTARGHKVLSDLPKSLESAII